MKNTISHLNQEKNIFYNGQLCKYIDWDNLTPNSKINIQTISNNQFIEVDISDLSNMQFVAPKNSYNNFKDKKFAIAAYISSKITPTPLDTFVELLSLESFNLTPDEAIVLSTNVDLPKGSIQ